MNPFSSTMIVVFMDSKTLGNIGNVFGAIMDSTILFCMDFFLVTIQY